MGSILISSLDECNSPNMAACRAIVCAQRLSRHEHTPGARPHTRQLTPSPQPCYSPSETRVCKSHHDKSPGNFLCSWQLHTHAFSLSCKKSIPNSSSRQKVGCIDTHGTQMVSFQENIFTFEIFYAGSLPGLTPGLSSSWASPVKARPAATPGQCALRLFPVVVRDPTEAPMSFSISLKGCGETHIGSGCGTLKQSPLAQGRLLLSWESWAAFLASLPASPHLWKGRVIISQEEMYIQVPCEFTELGCVGMGPSPLWSGQGTLSRFSMHVNLSPKALG